MPLTTPMPSGCTTYLAGRTGKGKGIKRSERKGSILNGFDDTEVEA